MVSQEYFYITRWWRRIRGALAGLHIYLVRLPRLHIVFDVVIRVGPTPDGVDGFGQ